MQSETLLTWHIVWLLAKKWDLPVLVGARTQPSSPPRSPPPKYPSSLPWPVDSPSTRPDLLVVDYAELLRPASKYTSEYDAEGDICASLTALARDFDMPIWTASQANRQALGRAHIGLENASDSSPRPRHVRLSQVRGFQESVISS